MVKIVNKNKLSFSLIMKKIIIIILFSLITNISYAASEKIYLKCEKVITKNKSTGLTKDNMNEGTFVQIALSEIIIGSKSTKITVYQPFPDRQDYEASFNKKIEAPAITKRKASIKDNSYTVKEGFSGKNEGSQLDIIDRYTFINKNNNWSVQYRHLLRDEKSGLDHNYIAEGKCVFVDKKYYKNLIKKGPSKADYNF